MLGNLDKRQVVIGAIIAALVAVVAVASFLVNQGGGAAPGGGGGGAAVTPGAPAVPSQGTTAGADPVQPGQPAAATQDPGRAVPPGPVAPYPGGGDSEDGTPFDFNNPPAGAPSTAEMRLARDNAVKYWTAMNEYGYGDESMADFTVRARPYMTGQNWEALTDVMSQSSPSDQAYFDTMVKEKRRKTVEVDDVVVTSWTGDSVLFTVTFRSADNVSGNVAATNMVQRAEVQVVADGGAWRVESAQRTN